MRGVSTNGMHKQSGDPKAEEFPPFWRVCECRKWNTTHRINCLLKARILCKLHWLASLAIPLHRNQRGPLGQHCFCFVSCEFSWHAWWVEVLPRGIHKSKFNWLVQSFYLKWRCTKGTLGESLWSNDQSVKVVDGRMGKSRITGVANSIDFSYCAPWFLDIAICVDWIINMHSHIRCNQNVLNLSWTQFPSTVAVVQYNIRKIFCEVVVLLLRWRLIRPLSVSKPKD